MLEIPLAQWWSLLPNQESVTLRVSGQPDVYLHKCVVTEPKRIRELAPTGGNVIRNGQEFIWPRRFAPPPPIGSIIIDKFGTYWTVWQCVYKDVIDMVEPFCLNLSITQKKWNRALLLKATYTHGEAGEAAAQWHGLFSGQDPPTDADTVRAHFQPSEEDSRIEFGGEWSRETFRVYLERPIPKELAGGEYRIVDSEGHRFRVNRYYDEERIDQLPTAICTKITEGEEYFEQPTPGP